MKRKRLFNREPKSLEEQYFYKIRPQVYQQHITHTQHGTRSGRSLAEHLDSACQFVLTVSKIAEVSEEKRGCILAATAVHDLNKLDQDQRRVQTLARDRAFLEQQLERAQVSQFVKTEEDLELVRRLIERHSGHNTTDGMRFLPEDPNIKRWAAMLIGADLFDLGIDKATRIRKVENELTVALGRETKLFEITLSEDRGYLTALLLAACEEVLHQYELHTLAINPNGQIFVGQSFPKHDLAPEIAQQWQKKIDQVFGSNVEELVTDQSTNGIKVDIQAIQQNSKAALDQVDALLVKKYSNYQASKVAESIEKYQNKAGEKAVKHAESLGLIPISNAEEFAISEGLKAAYVSYRSIQPKPTTKEVWQKINNHLGLSKEQSEALEAFDPQYGRCLFAVKASPKGMDGVRAALEESFKMRCASTTDNKTEQKSEKKYINAVNYFLNLPISYHEDFFDELLTYINAKPKERSSLGSIRSSVHQLKKPQMPPETKVQMFSNRLAGGFNGDPSRHGDSVSALAYQLLKVGTDFPKTKKKSKSGGDAPVHHYYLHFSLPKASSPELQAIWRKWLKDMVSTNADSGVVKVNELQLYRDHKLAFESKDSKEFSSLAFPKHPEFVQSTVIIPITWIDVSNSLALLKSLRLALELALALDVGFPFILGGNLEIEPKWDIFGQVEGISSPLQSLLGNGQYFREGQLSSKQKPNQLTAEQVLERLQCIGQLAVTVASLQKKDDCLYDLAVAAQRPLQLYYVLLRWALREQDDPNLEGIWNRIKDPLMTLLENLMSEEHDRVSNYLKQAARIAEASKLRGSSFRRTAQAEPFSEFIKAIRTRKSHLDWDTVFASLVQQYHNRLDRIREYNVGATKYEQIKDFYQVLRQLFDEVYNSRPERLLSDRKTLEAAYLFFLQEARQELKAEPENPAEDVSVTESANN